MTHAIAEKPDALSQLIERLEQATGPDKELDYQIARVVSGPSTVRQSSAHLPYTASIDAALTLVPEGWEWEATTLYGVARVGIALNSNTGGPFYGNDECGSVPIALCIAALRSRQAPSNA